MTRSLLLLPLCCLSVFVSSCGIDPGSFTMSFSWSVTPEGQVWVWARVEERENPTQPGPILASAGPVAYEFGDSVSLDMNDVANGDNRHIIVEVRDGANPNLQILYYGISDVFELVAGMNTHVDVPLKLQVPEAQAVEAKTWLEFPDQVMDTVGVKELHQATVVMESAHAVGVVLANDASFSVNFTELTLETAGNLTCEEQERKGIAWNVCRLTDWDLAPSPDVELQDQQYTVFVKFVDQFGYESQVYRASVVLDSQGPQVIMGSLTPSFAYPSSEVYLSISFHELADGDGGLTLNVSPALPPGAEIGAPQRVGTSTTYIWALSLGGDNEDWLDGPGEYRFTVDTVDGLGNPAPGQAVVDQDQQDLVLIIDALAPELLPDAGSSFSGSLFGLPDNGVLFSFEFVVQDEHPHLISTGTDGVCEGICPVVRLGNLVLGQVLRAETLDNPDLNKLGFRYEYYIADSDFTKKDSEPDVSVSWSDKAGNPLDSIVDGELRFDFQQPSALSCSLVPEFGSAKAVFTYTVTASEPLPEAPVLKVSSATDGLFATLPKMSDNGQTWDWQQAANGLPSQDIVVEAFLLDNADNASDGAVCQLDAAVDGEPPLLYEETEDTEVKLWTVPEVYNSQDDLTLVCGDGYELHVEFYVSEASGIAEGYPDVRLAVPGKEISLTPLVGEELTDKIWHYEYAATISAELHLESEGSWPVRVTLLDQSTNETVFDNLGGKLVKLDFTPPGAECSLIPPPDETGYPIGQKVMVQIFALEELPVTYVPVLVEEFEPAIPGDFFTYDSGSKYSFSRVIQGTDGEHSFNLGVSLTDLVGNTTAEGISACNGNTLLTALVDGEVPVVSESAIVVDGGEVDYTVTPLNSGRTVEVVVTTMGSTLAPDVTVGKGQMALVSEEPQGGDDGKLIWTFERTLDGSEGEGIQFVQIALKDESGNSTVENNEANPLTLDFTKPVAQCKFFPPSAKVGDTVTITVNTSEPLHSGLPGFLSTTKNFSFVEPAADVGATGFEYTHFVSEADADYTAWSYEVFLTDLAGNATESPVCSGSGAIDADPPGVDPGQVSVWTAPEVVDGEGALVLAVGPGDNLLVNLIVAEMQALPEGGVKVYVDIPGAPVYLAESIFEDGGNGFYTVQFERIFEPDDFDDPQSVEGIWPLKAQVDDLAGNITAVEGLGGELVQIDFTPPGAVCSLIPTPGELPYNIGQKIIVQASALEELAPQEEQTPVMTELWQPPFDEPFEFYFQKEQTLRYSATVMNGDGERSVELDFILTDLVGNKTPVDSGACTAGPLTASIDGTQPEVQLVEVKANGGDIDFATVPLSPGVTVTAQIRILNTAVKPTVLIGATPMMSPWSEPLTVGEDLYQWQFTWTLGGMEGNGEKLIHISGFDKALNGYEYTVLDQAMVFDFVVPKSQCKVAPALAKLGDTITLTVSTSETLQTGLPTVETDPIDFTLEPPDADPDATEFVFTYLVSEADANLQNWSFTINLTDKAGNKSIGPSCTGGGLLDAVAPVVADPEISTSPTIWNNDGQMVRAVADAGSVIVQFTVLDAQGLGDDYPKVYLNVPGNPLSFTQTGISDNQAGKIDYTFKLPILVVDHIGAEGSWPIWVVVEDLAGNHFEQPKLADNTRVGLDFTPPEAQCTLIPAPGPIPYNIGQKILVQASALEELHASEALAPVFVETWNPAFPEPLEPYFSEELPLRYYAVVADGDGERLFTVDFKLTDLVGNTTLPGHGACNKGSLVAPIDGLRPVVQSVVVQVEDGNIDYAVVPLKAGLTVTAAITVSNTDLVPEVKLGDSPMTASSDVPEEPEVGLSQWQFSRVLSGDEGHGMKLVSVVGADTANNAYAYTADDQPVTLDFIAPTAQCQVSPESAKLGDVIALNITLSEPVLSGLPDVSVEFNAFEFDAPVPDPEAIQFSYSHKVDSNDSMLQDWSYSVTLVDHAGNPSQDVVCSGSAIIDAVLPTFSDITMTTSPKLVNAEEETVLIAGDGGIISTSFRVNDKNGVGEGYPQVFLNAPGNAISLSQTSAIPNLDGSVDFAFELPVDVLSHKDAEGIWPLWVIVEDPAGNHVEEPKFADDKRVELDFTPPLASCSLIPAPPDTGYVVKDSIVLQISPFEELQKGSLPGVVESFEPFGNGEFFSYDDGTEYRYTGSVAKGTDSTFQLVVGMADLVGNSTPIDGNACVDGILTGTIDATIPTAQLIGLVVDGGAVNPITTPLATGRVVSATIAIEGTILEPEVTLGDGEMSASPDSPVGLGDKSWGWTFERTIDGDEGEGLLGLDITGQDQAGNSYSQSEDSVVETDFTSPTATCSVGPDYPGEGEAVTLSVNASEPLLELPVVDSGALSFEPASGEAGDTSFSFTHEVVALDGTADWDYSVTVTDLAGNAASPPTACSGSFTIDADNPSIDAGVVSTNPEITNSTGDIVLAVADSGQVIASFQVSEKTGVSGAPEVVLDVSDMDDEPEFTLSQTSQVDAETTVFVYQLGIEFGILGAHEGTWPVKVTVVDTHGNDQVETNLGGTGVSIDFSPPDADCSLIPSEGATPYGIDQKVTLQVTPSEELALNYIPEIYQTLQPAQGEDLFAYEEGTDYRFSGYIGEWDTDGTFTALIQLRDLVGNETAADGNACLISVTNVAWDAQRPVVDGITLSVDGGVVDPATVPLRDGRKVEAIIIVDGTDVIPDVLLGSGTMTAQTNEPVQLNDTAHQWVFERTLDGTEGQGEQPVTISGADASGNTYSYTQAQNLATLDFTSPTANCFMGPDPATLTDTITLSIVTSEAISGGLPVMISDLSFLAPASDETATEFVYTYLINDATPDELEWTYSVSLSDLAGNASDGLVCEGSGEIDQVAPSIVGGESGITVSESDIRDKAQFYLSFDLQDADDLDSQPTVKVGSRSMTSAPELDPDAQYVFAYTPDINGEPADTAGIYPLLITLQDTTGNQNFYSPGTVTFDFTDPTLIGDAEFDYTAPDGCLLYSVEELTHDTAMTVSISVDGVLESIPTVTMSGDAGEFTLVNTDPVNPYRTTFNYLFEESGQDTLANDTETTATVFALLEDLAGNTDTVELGTVTIDTLSPPVPAVVTPNTIIYTRIPWGTDVTDGDEAYWLRGSNGSVEANATVITYALPTAHVSVELGRTTADANGAFGETSVSGDVFSVGLADQDALYIVAVDSACNDSDTDADIAGTQGTEVRDVEWVATLGGKVAGSTAENPMTLENRRWFTGKYTQVDDAEAADTLNAGTTALASVEIEGAGDWISRTSANSVPAYRSPPAAWDAAREKLVIYGGQGVQIYDETWEWSDGYGWQQMTPIDPEGDGNPPGLRNHGLVYDSLREKVVLFGGSWSDVWQTPTDTWEWDGASWAKITRLDPEGDGNPVGRFNGAMAYDEARGVTVVAGGQNWDNGQKYLNSTWDWDGSSWRRGPNTHKAMYQFIMEYDQNLQAVVYYGGTEKWVENYDIAVCDGTACTVVPKIDNLGDGNPSSPSCGLQFVPDMGKMLVTCGTELWTWYEGEFELLPQTGTISGGLLYDSTNNRGIKAWGNLDGNIGLWHTDLTTLVDTQWTTPLSDGDPPVMGYHFGAFNAANGKMYVGNGRYNVQGGSSFHNAMWAWDGLDWAQVCCGLGFSAWYKVLWDPEENAILSPSGCTMLTWDNGWTGIPDADGICSSYGAATYFAYDYTHENVVQFAGSIGQYGYGNETWIWENHDWNKVEPTDPEGDGNPSPRKNHVMAWDPVRETVMTLGGSDTSNGTQWEWNGSSWAHVVPTDPEADGDVGWAEAIATDTDRNRVVAPAYGGGGSEHLWQWDGNSWKLVTPADITGDGRPDTREALAFVYDSTRQLFTLFGGYKAPSSYVNDLWNWLPAADERPGQVFSIPVAQTGKGDAAVLEMNLTWVAGAESTNVDQLENGVIFYVSDKSYWKVLANEPTFGLDTPGTYTWSSTDTALLSRLQKGAEDRVDFAVVPLYTNGPDYARVATDYVELTVRYRKE
jgi:hypothetical protein